MLVMQSYKWKIQKLPRKTLKSIGSDITLGQVLLTAGVKISSLEIGILATCGIDSLTVFRKPVVAVLSTGDEIMEPGASLLPGCIRDSNKFSLLCMLNENWIPTLDAGIAKDEPDAMKSRLVFAFEKSDVIITTGGVSMGEKDILKQVLEADFGAVIHFGRIHMKPGKPTTFSTTDYKGQKKWIFSLPGNPVSAYVCFYLFVIPCIKKLMGYGEPRHSTIKVQLEQDLILDERPEFARVSLTQNDEGVFRGRTTGGQQSSRLLSLQNADALIVLPPKMAEQPLLKAGSKVDAILLKAF